jgi:hypothetical protein
VLVSVHIELVLVVVLNSKEARVVKGPVDAVRVHRATYKIEYLVKAYVGMFRSPMGFT